MDTTGTPMTFTPDELAEELSLRQTGGMSRLDPKNRESLDPRARRRSIICAWPRDPKGKPIKATPRGKETPNGNPLWGATLLDIYRFHRIPDCFGLVTTSTGSKLAAMAKENGEVEWAKDEVEKATMEPDPELILPFDIGKVIPAVETRIRSGLLGKTALKSNYPKPTVAEGSEEIKKSIYDFENYPSPWPTVPFSYPLDNLALATPIRPENLPKKLYVHDPWGLLAADQRARHPDAPRFDDWTDKPDIIHEYKLDPSQETVDKISKGIKEKEKMAKNVKSGERPSGFLMRAEYDKEGPADPPLWIPFPPRPYVETPEAHLYLSPSHLAGSGNHSLVYYAEWELPRVLLCPPIICDTCLQEQLDELALDDDEEWEGEKGNVTAVLENPVGVMDVHFPDPKGGAHNRETYRVSSSRPRVVLKYEGPTRTVNVDLKWQTPGTGEPLCAHLQAIQDANPVPPTAKVRVTAKLSIQHDNHLAREAKNYQKFPDHFFEHWSGYNVVPPLHDPVPVAPLVPQFYGYYTPTEKSKAEYLSPILLLEDCGTPVVTKQLDMDDRQECGSLILRFHDAGWIHGSVADRNVLAQPGPLSTFPIFRNLPGHPERRSFRLIDFGRSWENENSSQRGDEETAAMMNFKLLHYT
ncbi:hypothetical protein BD779DRAFT_1544303 [Infundibulicybe gibba]|nr:hypothetical protein BD779DRAFT_1544303 [Infundibulicybe gibba]